MSERKPAVINDPKLALKVYAELGKQMKAMSESPDRPEILGSPRVRFFTDGHFQCFDLDTGLCFYEGELGFPIPDTELTPEGMIFGLQFDRKLRERGIID